MDERPFLLQEWPLVSFRPLVGVCDLDDARVFAVHRDLAGLFPQAVDEVLRPLFPAVDGDPHAGGLRVLPGTGDDGGRLLQHVVERSAALSE